MAEYPELARQKRPSNSSRSYPRKRAFTACSQCRQRKKKCDNLRPACGYCTELQINCTYDDPTNHSTFDPASLQIVSLLHQTLQGIGDLRTRLDGVLPDQLKTDTPMLEISPPSDNPFDVEQHCPASSVNLQTSWESPNSTTLGVHTNNETPKDLETDYLRIPSSRITPDAILRWPVFEGKFSSEFLKDTSETPSEEGLQAGGDVNDLSHVSPLKLVDDFLSYVHIKNPILDVNTLRGYARRVSEIGFEWNGPSCLVAIACALGCVSGPYLDLSIELSEGNDSEYNSSEQSASLQKAELFYVMARRRIGLLRNSIITSQCFFFSAVYCMYRLRPLEACTNFVHASTTYQAYLKLKSGQVGQKLPQLTCPSQDLEDRLYWSCFKSECEFQRTEAGLPESGITNYPYPSLFPAPPNIDSDASDACRQEQEQAWYYYSTEITLCRISNRVLNAFYQAPATAWLDISIPSMIRYTEHFLNQIAQCINDLPIPIRYNQDDLSTFPTEELPALIRARILEIKCNLLRPFLFYTIHSPPSETQLPLIRHFVEDCVTYELHRIRTTATRHRHHGTWFACRATMSAAFAVGAAVKSRRINVPPDWGNVFRLAIETLKYWAPEAPELTKPKEILETLLADLERLE